MSFVPLRVKLGLRWEKTRWFFCHLLSITVQFEDSWGMRFVWGITRGEEDLELECFFSPQGCRLQSEKSFRRGHGQMGQIFLRLTCIVCYSFLYLQRNGFVWEIWVRKLKMTKWVNKKSPSETASGSWWASTQKNWISFSRTESLPHAPINYIWMQFTVQASANPSFRQLFLNSDSSIWQTGGGKCTPRFMASLSGEHFISQAVMSSFVLTLTPSIP